MAEWGVVQMLHDRRRQWREGCMQQKENIAMCKAHPHFFKRSAWVWGVLYIKLSPNSHRWRCGKFFPGERKALKAGRNPNRRLSYQCGGVPPSCRCLAQLSGISATCALAADYPEFLIIACVIKRKKHQIGLFLSAFPYLPTLPNFP